MTHLFRELRQLSKQDLIDEYDRVAPSTQPGLAFLREELFRRDLEEQNARIERMTRTMCLLTVIIAFLTLLNTVAVVCALWRP